MTVLLSPSPLMPPSVCRSWFLPLFLPCCRFIFPSICSHFLLPCAALFAFTLTEPEVSPTLICLFFCSSLSHCVFFSPSAPPLVSLAALNNLGYTLYRFSCHTVAPHYSSPLFCYSPLSPIPRPVFLWWPAACQMWPTLPAVGIMIMKKRAL